MPRPTPPWRRSYRSRRSTHRSTGWAEWRQGEAKDGPIEVGTGLGGFCHHPFPSGSMVACYISLHAWLIFLWFSCKEIYQSHGSYGIWKMWVSQNWIMYIPKWYGVKIFQTYLKPPPASFFFPMTIGKPRKTTNCQQKMEIWVNYICWEIG